MEYINNLELMWLRIQTWARRFKVKLGPEQEEQIKVFCWINCHPEIEPFAFHIANERKSSQIMGMILKYMGVKPGVSDIMIAIPSPPYHGLFIELKAGRNKPTPAQSSFLARVTQKGYLGVCVTGHEAAIETIKTYLREQ